MPRKTVVAKRPARGPDAPRPRARRPVERTIELEQIRGKYLATGYTSGTALIRDGRTAASGSGDLYLQLHRDQLVNQAREFGRNNGIFRGMIDRATAYIVGNGFKLQAKSSNPNWNALAEREWKRFWRRPDHRGLLSGRRVERMVCREILTVGDTAIAKLKTGKIQLFEAEQLRSATSWGDGLVRNSTGAIVGYTVAPYRRGYLQTSDLKPYSVADMLFITDPERPSSSRAVPPAQASFPMLHRIDDMCNSEAIAAQLLARLAITISKKNATLDAFTQSRSDPDLEGSDTSGVASTRITDIDWATIFWAEPGEEIKGVERNIPGKDFPATIQTFLRLLGLPLGLPLEIILLDWTKSNYSQSRAVLEQAYVTFLGWQLLLEEFFYEELYTWCVQRAVDDGRLEDIEDKFEHEWIKPTFPWIDQLKEAQAWKEKLAIGLCTHTQALKSQNLEREDVITQRKREVLEAIAISDEIFAKTKVRVPYQWFMGAEASVNPAAPAKDDKDDGEPEKEPKDE